MSKKSDFFIYLLEGYAEFKGKIASEVLKEWNRLDITNLIYDMYEIYHIEKLENAYEDIDNIILEKINNK